MTFDIPGQAREEPPVVVGLSAVGDASHTNGSAPASDSVPNSVNDDGPDRQGRRSLVRGVRHWGLWTRPVPAIAYLVICELAVVTGATIACVRSPLPGGLDWFRFGMLGICATTYIQLSRRQEERRRNLQSKVHIDLTAIWMFPAVLVLPIQLALALMVLVRIQRWFTARRPLYRFMFSTSSVSSAILLTHALVNLIGPHEWTLPDGLGSLGSFAALAVAGLVYGGIQVAVIGGFVALEGHPTLQKVLGTKEDNALETVTIALGIVAAILLANLPAALVIMVLVSVVGSRIAEVRQLQVDVRTDPKTGLLNMRGWRESAERALERSSRVGTPTAVLMVDLDHFKSINDTWGHPAGDDVLELVAGALRSETRPGDVVGRFGGEEFVLLLPEVNAGEAMSAGERIRRTIAGLEVPTTDKRGGPVAISERTTSVGIAVYPHHGATLDGLLQLADAAVYEAKENGRDQVRLAAQLPDPRPVR